MSKGVAYRGTQEWRFMAGYHDCCGYSKFRGHWEGCAKSLKETSDE